MLDFYTEQYRRNDKYESRENILRKSTIKIHKKLKIDLMKITESLVKEMMKKHKKTGN